MSKVKYYWEWRQCTSVQTMCKKPAKILQEEGQAVLDVLPPSFCFHYFLPTEEKACMQKAKIWTCVPSVPSSETLDGDQCNPSPKSETTKNNKSERNMKKGHMKNMVKNCTGAGKRQWQTTMPGL